MEHKIKKTIHFYKITAWKMSNNEEQEVDIRQLFKQIENLSFNNGDRYLDKDDGDSLSMSIHSNGNTIDGKMGLCRRHNLPYKHEDRIGKESPLGLGVEESLYEPSHFVVFKNNVIGFEYNFSGPRISAIKGYLVNKNSGNIDIVRCEPLMNSDVRKMLRQYSGIKAIGLAIKSPDVNTLKGLDKDMHEVFSNLKKYGDSEIIEVIIKTRKKYGILNKIHAFLDKLPAWLNDNVDTVDKLKIKGLNINSHRIEEIDILHNFVISKKDFAVEDDRYRHVNEVEMYKNIKVAYEELYTNISSALSVLK